MIRPIVKDALFLSQKSTPATIEDLDVAQDLRDTLQDASDRCVGMAANMIGSRKRIIIVSLGFTDLVMLNPIITKKSDPYQAEEGCLSLPGSKVTTRYRNITVRYLDEKLKEHTQSFSGIVAQTIQHECDHLEGILI